MGKTKRVKISSKVDSDQQGRNAPLAEQILEDKSVRCTNRIKSRSRAKEEEFVDDRLSKKIIEQARKQQEELEEDHGSFAASSTSKDVKNVVKLDPIKNKMDSESEDEEDSAQVDEYSYETVEVDADDEAALEQFMSANPPTKQTLADIIMEKITEKQTEIRSQLSDNASVRMEELDERVVVMYKEVKNILSRYRSGKLPKAFKIIPALSNWEQILYLTEPETWTAAAVYQATRIFSSNLNSKMAQRFYNLVLLPRVRDDISEYKKLNFHLFQALKKSLFKPAAFFKGVLLPMCESGTCTLREAVIMASVLSKNSIPMLHSAAAILKIAEADYNGANSIFLRTLLDKKYALPYRVVDAIVFHFVRFTRDERELPVLWHQALLTFVQRYKGDISSEQKEALYELLRVHTHAQITPEVRRELSSSKCRDLEATEPHNVDMS